MCGDPFMTTLAPRRGQYGAVPRQRVGKAVAPRIEVVRPVLVAVDEHITGAIIRHSSLALSCRQ